MLISTKAGFTCLAVIFLVSFQSIGQQMAGIIGSNYAGTNSLYFNPSSLVDSRYKIYVNLAGLNYFAGNNAVKWDAPYSLINFALDKAQNQKKYQWDSDYLTPRKSLFKKNFHNIFEVNGPAILYTINDRQAVAISSRGKSFINFKNVSKELSSLILYGPDSPLRNPEAKNQNININLNNTAEIALSYAQDIALNSEEAISLGISVKRVIGISNFHFIGRDSDYQLVTILNPDLSGTYIENVLNIQQLEASYGFSDDRKGLEDFSFRPGYWLGKPSPGRAIAADIGITYELRPDINKYISRKKGISKTDLTKNKYKLKLGAAITDIGSIRFDNSAYVSNFDYAGTNNLVLEENMRLFPLRRLLNGINTQLNTDLTTNKQNFRSKMATALHLSADYHLFDNYYINAQLSQNLRLSNSIGMMYPSSLMIVPRYETKWLDLAVPVGLMNNYQLFTIGMAARLGPVFIGSDNLQGLFSIAKPRGVSLYGGVSLPIFHKNDEKITDCPDLGVYKSPKKAKWKIFEKKARN